MICVVGGGPAGMMAAITAAKNGSAVTLLEKNEKLGKKLYITGKGRCNLTNNCTRDEFMENVNGNARFMFSSFSALNPQDLMTWFEERGVPLVTERGRRVFPESQKSSDILRCLDRECHRVGVEVRLNAEVESLIVEGDRVVGVHLAHGRDVYCDEVILATGGLSYPVTGSTGDGMRWADQLGHRIKKTRPGLVPLKLSDIWVPTLQGLSLKNVALKVKRGKKQIFSDLGEMMFTHYGITGPLVLTLSSLVEAEDEGEMIFHLDLKPGMTDKELQEKLIRECAQEPERSVRNMLAKRMPSRLAPVVAQLANVTDQKPSHQLTREERNRIVMIMKDMQLHYSGTMPYAEAVITRGGVDVRDIHPATMASRKMQGLYFAGEMMDVDAFTGGYNLQIAFSTGYAAGLAAAQEEE